MSPTSAMTTTRVNDDLQTIYHRRFTGKENYRQQVWGVLLSDFFQRFVPIEGSVLDLGSGYGEFINGVRCGARYAMDLNPDAGKYLNKGDMIIVGDYSVFKDDLAKRFPNMKIDVVKIDELNIESPTLRKSDVP